MELAERIISYTGLPISSGGAHGLRQRNPHKAYETLKSLLSVCEQIGPLDIGFRCDGLGYDWENDPHVPEDLRARTRPLVERVHEVFPPNPSGKSYIRVPVERLEEALELMASLQPQPMDKYKCVPVWFFISAEFFLLDPDTGRALPGQVPYTGDIRHQRFGPPHNCSSRAGLSIDYTAHLSLDLLAPAETEAVAVRSLARVQKPLPFKLSKKHWLTLTKPKRGTNYVRRKIPSPLVTG